MITSTANQQIKNLIQLQKKSRARQEQDVFVAEGVKMYQEAPKERIVKTYVSESFYEKHGKAWFQGREMPEIAADHVFAAISDTKTPQGILCVVRRRHDTLEEVLGGETPLILVAENLQDPGNLGTILRAGEGAGVTGIVLSRDTVDIYNPKTIRSTMGSVYRVPFCYADDMTLVLKMLKERQIVSYAAHLKGRQMYDAPDYRKGTAFLIGNEGNGLSEELAACAEQYILIPMCGKVESLNAGVASAVLMYEAQRQRRKGVVSSSNR